MGCEDCSTEEVDFVLEDGTEYCAECMIRAADEVFQQKQNNRECPYCKKNIREDKYLFHIATEHREET